MQLLHRLSEKATFANIAAGTALAVALTTGTAYAAQLGKNTVGSKQIVNGSIAAKDVKKNTLTGDQVDEGSLATVPSAQSAASAATAALAADSAALGGTAATSYGRVVAHDRRAFTTGDPFRVPVAGIGSMGFNCEASGDMTLAQSLNGPAGWFIKVRAQYADSPVSPAVTYLYNGEPAQGNSTYLSAGHIDVSALVSNPDGSRLYQVSGSAYDDPSGCNAFLTVVQLRG